MINLKILKKILPFLALILLWQLVSWLGLLNADIVPGPAAVFKSFLKMLYSGDLLLDIFYSVKRVFIGFIFAAVFGVTLGVLLSYFKRASFIFTPIFELLRPIPPIAWIPIAILWFGLGDKPAYFIVFVGSFFPIFINSFWGIRETKTIHLNVARNFGASSLILFTDVLLPCSLPRILHGLRIGLGLAWTSVISAELVGAQSGLGYMIQLNRIMLKTSNIIAGMVVIGMIGFTMNYFIHILEKKLTLWNKDTIYAR